jgi:hypothetical protein
LNDLGDLGGIGLVRHLYHDHRQHLRFASGIAVYSPPRLVLACSFDGIT